MVRVFFLAMAFGFCAAGSFYLTAHLVIWMRP